MKLAVLPLNAAQGTPPALGRQFSTFAADTVRVATSAEINSVNYLAQMEDEDGPRAAFVNVADTLMEHQFISQVFQQGDVERVMDGLLKVDGDQFEMTYRWFGKDSEEPVLVREGKFPKAGIFNQLRLMVQDMADQAEVKLPDELQGDQFDFGTDNPDAFLWFMEGYDAFQYINQANGRVAREFVPKQAMDTLLKACEADADFLAPYETLVQLCRACAHFQLGNFQEAESSLLRLTELAPDDFRAYFGLGEIYQSVNNPVQAAEYYEKAIQHEPNDAALYTRLGMAQMAMGMPANAERNFRRAIEMEGDDKPSIDFLANVLTQTDRGHEVPALFKEVLDKNPLSPELNAKYAASLYNAGREDEAMAAFEHGLETVEDNAIIKRFYAPALVKKGDLDHAMDMYEDCIDSAPSDIQLLSEYAQTLQAANREFEIPPILKTILASNPDVNTKAQTQAWLTELEQPKRAEAVENARQKLESGDAEGALKDLKPLRNWLADYWKMWLYLSAAYNRLGLHEDAKDAAERLVNLAPACEPAYGELVHALSSMGNLEDAYRAMRFAATQIPNSLSIGVNLAMAAKRAGHEDEARGLSRQIREAVGPNYPEGLEEVLNDLDR